VDSSVGAVTGCDVADRLRLIDCKVADPRNIVLGNQQRLLYEAVKKALVTETSLVKFSVITVPQNLP
jgi:hypothetical protein